MDGVIVIPEKFDSFTLLSSSACAIFGISAVFKHFTFDFSVFLDFTGVILYGDVTENEIVVAACVGVFGSAWFSENELVAILSLG